MIVKHNILKVLSAGILSASIFIPSQILAAPTTTEQESITLEDKIIVTALAGYGEWWKKDSCVIPPLKEGSVWWMGTTCNENLTQVSCIHKPSKKDNALSCEEKEAYKHPNRWAFYTAVDFNEKHELYNLLKPSDKIYKDYEGKIVPEVLNCPWIKHILHTEDFSNIVLGVDFKNRKFTFKNISNGSYGEILTGLTVYKIDVKNRGAFITDNKVNLRRVFTINKGRAVYTLSDRETFSVDENGFVTISR